MPKVAKASKRVGSKVSKKVARAGVPAKTAVKKASAAPAKKSAPVVKVAKKVVKKSARAGAKPAAPATTATESKRAKTPEGVEFLKGSDMQYAFFRALEGDTSRVEMSRALMEHWKESPTRGGGPKPVSTIVNHVVSRALKSGYHVEESWRLVPDPGTALPEGAQEHVDKGIRKVTSNAVSTLLVDDKPAKRSTKKVSKGAVKKAVKRTKKA